MKRNKSILYFLLFMVPALCWGQISNKPIYSYDCYEIMQIESTRDIRGKSYATFGYQVQELNGHLSDTPYIKSVMVYPYELTRDQAHVDSVYYALELAAIESAMQCDTIDLNDYFMNPLMPSGSSLEFENLDNIVLSNYRVVNTVECATIVYFETLQEYNDTSYHIMNVAVIRDSLDGPGDIRWSYPIDLIPDKKERNKILSQKIRDVSSEIPCEVQEPKPFADMWMPVERIKRTAVQKKVRMSSTTDIHYMNESELMTAVITGTKNEKKKIQSIKVKSGDVLYAAGLIKVGNSYTLSDKSFTLILGGQDIKVKPSKSLSNNYKFDIY